jgi:hypothetical protein
LLRDEAVLFGLSEARPDEKIAAIRLAFAALTAAAGKAGRAASGGYRPPELIAGRGGGRAAKAVWGLFATQVRRLASGTCLLGLLGSIALCVGTYLGTASMTNAQLALLAAGLAGLSCCAATLFILPGVYRSALTNSCLAQSRDEEIRKQQMASKLTYQQQKRKRSASYTRLKPLLTSSTPTVTS